MEHGPFFYLIPWSVAFGLALVVLWGAMSVPYLKRHFVRPEVDREQSMPRYYRLGGVLLLVIFLLILLGYERLERNLPFLALCVGSGAILLFSLADDLAHVRWPWHLGFQALLGLLVFFSGMELEWAKYLGTLGHDLSPWFGPLGVILWIMLIMNALNWADGTDGLMPGVAALSFAALFLLALRPEVNQPTIALLAVLLFGLALGLALFNWHPARILAGTGGAYFFGFALAVLALYAGMKAATIMLILAVPVLDAVFVIVRRLFHGHSPFLPDKEHFHHSLLARGWSPARVATTYLLVTALMGILALSLEGLNKAFAFGLAGSFLLLWSLHSSFFFRKYHADL